MDCMSIFLILCIMFRNQTMDYEPLKTNFELSNAILHSGSPALGDIKTGSVFEVSVWQPT